MKASSARLVSGLLAALLVGLSTVTGGSAQVTAEALEKQAAAAEQAGRMGEAFELYLRALRALKPVPPLDIDVRIRGRLLAIAPGLQPQPPVPDEAERSSVRGQVLFRDARDQADLEKAMAELRNAVRAAPWLPELAFNLALVQEKAAFYRSAVANLKLYLGTNPGEGQKLRSRIYELELRLETDGTAAKKEDCALGDSEACAFLAKEEAVKESVARYERIQRELEELKKVSMTWTVINRCATKDVNVRFFESQNGTMTGQYPLYEVKRGTERAVGLSCQQGQSVCYGGDLSWRTWFGIGPKGDKGCDDCCAACGTHDYKLLLTCNASGTIRVP